MRKLFIVSFLTVLSWLGLSCSGFAAPTSEIMVSKEQLALDETITVEVKFSWPKSEGLYKFVPPEWKLQNLKFVNESRADESFQKEGVPWNRVDIKYEFKPEKEGKASIGLAKLSYLNTATQESGSLTIVRRVDFTITRAQRSAFWFINMTLILAGVLVAGGAFVAWHSKMSAAKMQQEKERRAKSEFEAVISKIQNVQGSSKDKAFEWGTQFKIFMVHYFHLPSSIMTEQEAMDALKNSTEISKKELEKVSSIFERISVAKFATKDIPEENIAALQRDLIEFIQGKMAQ